MDTSIVTWKSTKFTNHLYSMHPNGNNQLQILNWWVSLRSALDIFSFWSDLCKYLSIISTMCPKDKTLKETVHFLKKIILYLSTAPLSNVKLKRVSKVYHVLYNNSAGKNYISQCQHTEDIIIKVRALLY